VNRSSTVARTQETSRRTEQSPAPSGILRRPSRGISGGRGGNEEIPLSSLNDTPNNRIRPVVLTTEEHEMVMRNQNVNNRREQTSYQQQRDASTVVSPPSAQRRQGRARNEEQEGVNRA
jgi:hypothetical protein